MPPLFVDSLELQRAPGVYAIELAPPVVVEGQVLGYVGIAFAGEWGPPNVVTEPSGTVEFNSMYFPPGSPHNSQGYYALMRRKAMPLRPVRIMNGGVQAVVTAAAGAGFYTATAKYPGTLGNSIVLTWLAATDGDSAHRDLTIELSDPVTGATRERVRNVAHTDNDGVAAALANSLLLASLVFDGDASALPAASTVALLGATTPGTNGSAITLTQYSNALALFRSRRDIFVVVTDDPGNSLRNTVNDALVAHTALTRSCLTVFQASDPNAAWATVKTLVNTHSPTFRSDRSLPQGAWVYVQDDAGTLRVSPFATFVASAIVNSEPQRSHAWRDDRMTQFYSGVAEVYAPFSTADDDIQGDATEQGIGLPIREDDGPFASLHDRTSSLTTSRRFTTTRRIKDFLARSILRATRSFVNGQNFRGKQLDIQALTNAFLKSQDTTSRPDEPRVTAWSTSIVPMNDDAAIAAGRFYVSVDGRTPGVMEKIGFLFNVGETVTVRETGGTE